MIFKKVLFNDFDSMLLSSLENANLQKFILQIKNGWLLPKYFLQKNLKISLVILVPYKIDIRKLIQLCLSAWSKKSRSNGTSIGMIALLSFSLQFTNLGEIRQSDPFMEHYCKYYRQGFVVFWNQLLF